MSVMATTDLNRTVQDATTRVDDKPERVSLVELKNGKLAVKQKPLSFEKMSETMQEIVQFREMLEERIERKAPSLIDIPDDHRPLIAKMTQESDKTIAGLSKHIQQELLPAQDEDDEEACKEIQSALSLDVIEKSVKAVAVRTNYGLDVTRIPNAPVSAKIPVAWQVWRWEVKEEFREWLPKAFREKALARLAERKQILEDVVALFQSLPESDQSLILSGNAKISTLAAKVPIAVAKPAALAAPESKDLPQPTPTALPAEPGTPSGSLKRKHDENEDDSVKQQSEDPESPAKAAKGRPKKPVDPEKAAEKAAKEKERLEKKLAKAEKEKKAQEAQSRSRNLMASFFSKQKAPAASSSAALTPSGSTSSVAQEKPATVSEFEKTFKPFLVKKDATLAPTNWFAEVRAGRTYKGKEKEDAVIVIDDDENEPKKAERSNLHEDEDVQMVDASEWKGDDPHLGQKAPHDRLRDSLRALHPRLRPPALPCLPRRHPTLKSYHPYVVRTVIHKLNEAEVAGEDDQEVRKLLALLRDRTKIPAKVLIFHEDQRPGYFGTWTRNSREVGPRQPFGKDVVSIDYSVDSEAEWEDEEEGDVLEDAGEEEEEDGGAAEDVDSELDDWLVDDDEPVEPGTPIDERFGSPDFPPLPAPSKRKVKEEEKEKEKKPKKRRVVEQLVQFEKGPCWESTLGQCAWEPFKAMRIEFFNDTPVPIDPFKYVAPSYEHVPTGKAAPQAPQPAAFAVPALPAHVASMPAAPANPDAKRPAVAPKTAFPEASMPVLLAKIRELNTGSLAVIVEGVYKELGTLVKKNAIEAKVREVGEKSKEAGAGKVWVVKPEVRALYGST
ncbi:CAF1A domain-containing protein [Phanerochaete sordida]|uniref:CAF1A domain-containing protein n=1 Tax=Phanerochaete sordida TaxID=48140 RepID=A0A9P3G3D1_9APHY|nr:CAF1A domain-containing protein [Phanerochaete sordida]